MKKHLWLILAIAGITTLVVLEWRLRARRDFGSQSMAGPPPARRTQTPVAQPPPPLDPDAAAAAIATSTVVAAASAVAGSTTAAAASAAPPTQKPVVAIEDGKTIDFSTGDAVIKADPEEKARIERSLKDIDAATADVTFGPKKSAEEKKPAAPKP
jgi:hypothetical protein